jgi:hypothetical protein
MILEFIVSHKILVSVVLAVFFTQLIKIIIRLVALKDYSWHDIFRTGGMPSAHSALVVSLVLSIFLSEGFSTSFVIAFVFLTIVLRDAMGVRRSVGEEGKVLVKVANKLKMNTSELHVAMGHTPLQVLVGSLISIIVTILVYVIF